jgi:electron transfer flavoprotein alpha subunit
MALLVVAEHHHGGIDPATAHAVSAAAAIGGEIHVLVAGKGCEAAVKAAAALAGVTKVRLADDAAYEHGLAENVAPLIASVGKDYSHIIATATSWAKDVLPRAAALLDAQQISDVTKIVSPDTFIHPIYAGNALETVQSKEAIKIMTVRKTAFPAAAPGGNAAIEPVSATSVSGASRFVSKEETKSERPELTAARIVVSGGRGLGSAENFKLIERIADKLGAAIGASRAAVDSGYVPNDYQVGQTGKVVAPDLYIAVGISGAIQHLAGMKDSKVIVAINKDENAPIFEIADYGLVGDLFTILPELEKALG